MYRPSKYESPQSNLVKPQKSITLPIKPDLTPNSQLNLSQKNKISNNSIYKVQNTQHLYTIMDENTPKFENRVGKPKLLLKPQIIKSPETILSNSKSYKIDELSDNKEYQPSIYCRMANLNNTVHNQIIDSQKRPLYTNLYNENFYENNFLQKSFNLNEIKESSQKSKIIKNGSEIFTLIDDIFSIASQSPKSEISNVHNVRKSSQTSKSIDSEQIFDSIRNSDNISEIVKDFDSFVSNLKLGKIF